MPEAPVGSMLARPERDARVVARSDVVVVGGGPAGVAAAVAAARNGASVTLLERYAFLGGMASGGMVLVLDDMANGDQVTVAGLAQEYVDRLERIGLAVYPPVADRHLSQEMWDRWSRWGVFDLYHSGRIKPIVYAVAFDPQGWKQVSNDLVAEAGVQVRLHSWFTQPLMEGDRIVGVLCETKRGPEVTLGDVVVDASGDADVSAGSQSPVVDGGYIVSTVFRLGNVRIDDALRLEREAPAEAAELNRRARQILGGSWALWWLRTPLPGVVWCNCPHMTGYDGISVEHLTAAEFEGRRKIAAVVEYARSSLPGFADAFLVDVAPQIGVRQTRLLEGEYVVTKEDVVGRRHFTDSVARGRDYYTPYRSLLPRGVEQLLVAGRHYSATPEAQKLSREIPPCIAMGEATGIAAAQALARGVRVRDVDVASLQRAIRAQGGDPGDVPSANARPPIDPELALR